MEIATSFSEQSLHELNRANRNWPYWPVRLVGHPRIFALLAGTGLFALRSLYVGFTASPRDGDNLLTGFVLLALIAAVIAILLYRERAALRKEALSPQVFQLTIDNAGFLSRSQGTQPARHEWSQFSSFSVGTHIVFLWLKHSRKRAIAIPTDTLSLNESGQLRSILLSHLPEKS